MKIKYQLIILILIFFCSSGFSQKDSSIIVGKREVKKFHTKIFALSVDSTIDSSAIYKLIYLSEKGWSQGHNNPNSKKKYRSSYFLTFDSTMISIAEILKFPESSKDNATKDSLFLDQTPVNIPNESISYISMDYIVRSRQDYYFKKLKNKRYHIPFMKGVIALGGKYLLVATNNVYIGNTSWSSTKYLYYEKIK